MRRHTLIMTCLSLFWWATSVLGQIPLKSTNRLVYDNRPYGYMVTLPRDLTYTRTGPPNPDHGFGVILPGSNKFWVDASYTDSSSNEEEAGIITAGCRIDEKRTTALGGQPALSLRFSCPASEDRRAYTELVTLAVHSQGDRSSADYQIGLRVFGSNIPNDEKLLFDRVVHAFRFEK